MNMHGVMIPSVEGREETRLEWIRHRISSGVRRWRAFLLAVALPTGLIAAYYYLIASDRYVSEAHFLVRNASQQSAPPSNGLGQMLNAATGISTAQSEAISIADYLSSHDAVRALGPSFNLVARFQRPGVDLLSRLHGSPPTPERMLKYYRDHVAVKFDPETGITTITADTFQPSDSFELVQRLLELGEQRVNVLNRRNYTDSVANARQQLANTETQLAAAQTQLTHYRQSRRDINPETSGTVQVSLVAALTNQLTTARAQLVAMGNAIDHHSPQYVALARQVHALEAQVAAQSARIAGGGNAIAADVGGYEDLRMRQDFLMKQYEADMASLDKARDQAQRQHLYVVRVVEPNLPVKSTRPERGRIVITIFIGLLVAYAIGWLIVAGTREHAA